MKTLRLLVLIALSAIPVWAADATGVWTGVMTPDGNPNPSSAYMVIRQEGEKLTGTGGPNEGVQYPLSGSSKDDQLVFDVTTQQGTLHFELKIEGDRLRGRGEMRRGTEVVANATVDLTRQPAPPSPPAPPPTK